MKTAKLKNTLVKATAIILTLGCISLPAFASTSYTTADTGYWVVESNTLTKDFTLIKFYDAQHQLMYEERLEGVCLDIKKRKNVKMLNKTLKLVETNSLVAGQLKGYQQQFTFSLARKR